MRLDFTETCRGRRVGDPRTDKDVRPYAQIQFTLCKISRNASSVVPYACRGASRSARKTRTNPMAGVEARHYAQFQFVLYDSRERHRGRSLRLPCEREVARRSRDGGILRPRADSRKGCPYGARNNAQPQRRIATRRGGVRPRTDGTSVPTRKSNLHCAKFRGTRHRSFPTPVGALHEAPEQGRLFAQSQRQHMPDAVYWR